MNFLRTPQNWSALCHKQAARHAFKNNTCKLLLGLFALLLLSPAFSYAEAGKSLNDILKLKNKPAGVIIEIVTGDEENLEWALPRAKEYIQQLREKFPELPLAIVTHGPEQFALTESNKQENKEIHQLVKSLGADDVPVHICETFAGWRGLAAEDFPDYVNVAAAGPAQVNDYIAIGYELIVIDEE